MNVRWVFLAVIFGYFPLENLANSNDSLINVIFKHIYNHEFLKAESDLISNQKILENFHYEILTIDLYWWKYISSESKNDLARLKKAFNEFGEKLMNSPEEKIAQLVVLSYRLRFDLKRLNLMDVAVDRYKISKILKEINKTRLPYPENRLLLFDLYKSLFNYFDNYFTPMVLVNKTSRLEELAKLEIFLLSNDLIVQTYTLYFLGKIWLDLEKDNQKAGVNFKKLSENFPGNKLFKELYQKCLPAD